MDAGLLVRSIQILFVSETQILYFLIVTIFVEMACMMMLLSTVTMEILRAEMDVQVFVQLRQTILVIIQSEL